MPQNPYRGAQAIWNRVQFLKIINFLIERVGAIPESKKSGPPRRKSRELKKQKLLRKPFPRSQAVPREIAKWITPQQEHSRVDLWVISLYSRNSALKQINFIRKRRNRPKTTKFLSRAPNFPTRKSKFLKRNRKFLQSTHSQTTIIRYSPPTKPRFRAPNIKFQQFLIKFSKETILEHSNLSQF